MGPSGTLSKPALREGFSMILKVNRARSTQNLDVLVLPVLPMIDPNIPLVS